MNYFYIAIAQTSARNLTQKIQLHAGGTIWK